jgi:hypothetical protein
LTLTAKQQEVMSLAQVLAQQETTVSDARISQLSECKFLSEQEVIELAAKCKVSCRQFAAVHAEGCTPTNWLGACTS